MIAAPGCGGGSSTTRRDRLLDVGCGAGVLTCALRLALPHAEIVGIDAVPEAVACAQELAARLGSATCRS